MNTINSIQQIFFKLRAVGRNESSPSAPAAERARAAHNILSSVYYLLSLYKKRALLAATRLSSHRHDTSGDLYTTEYYKQHMVGTRVIFVDPLHSSGIHLSIVKDEPEETRQKNIYIYIYLCSVP